MMCHKTIVIKLDYNHTKPIFMATCYEISLCVVGVFVTFKVPLARILNLVETYCKYKLYFVLFWIILNLLSIIIN